VKIYVYYIGKARDEHSNGIAAEFLKRTSRYLKCEMREIHPDRFDLFTRHASATKVLLDPAGKKFDSAQFTAMVEKAENEARDLIFVNGGADGLPTEWRPRADLLLSLSPMRFPHELARAMLSEQVYRALTTLRRHPTRGN
jgi:23S rRNA (pseudouridine1915-N3)-methyltransferase